MTKQNQKRTEEIVARLNSMSEEHLTTARELASIFRAVADKKGQTPLGELAQVTAMHLSWLADAFKSTSDLVSVQFLSQQTQIDRLQSQIDELNNPAPGNLMKPVH